IPARKKRVRDMIGKNDLVINLKDWRSVIVGGTKTYINKTGNPGMTKGGFGDVLAGFTASFWAQGMPPFEAAACAAWLNGRMSDRLKRKKWYGYIASDILEEARTLTKRTF
ncbi:MAG: NAD(P)H-hydrate dehydratase, partial [archaeon]|nr:NAD(P)H-hydrate dehydratase [archaeon]